MLSDMAPAQAFVNAKAEIPEHSLKSSSQTETENTNEVYDEEILRCTSNCEDKTIKMETLNDQHQVEETEDVDITYGSDTTSVILQEEDPDATEHSSSFGGTISGSEEGSKFNSSDVEVESQYHAENELSAIYDGFGRFFPPRQKRLTAHWRRYIRPLMWRCKWIELRVKELQSQASKYDKLVAHSKEKQVRVDEVAIQSSVARSMPLLGQSRRQRIMKRRKRTRMEETVDIPSYMARHSLFAYYENKKHEADAGVIDDDCNNQVTPANMPNKNADADASRVIPESPQLNWKDGDSALEQFLWSIELLQSQVGKLKSRLDEVISKNIGQSSSVENLSNWLPNDLPSVSTLSPTLSPVNGGQMPVGALYMSPNHHISEYEIGDLVMTESAVSNFGDVTLPDVIESTVGLFSADGRSFDLPQSGDSPEYFDDGILIHKHSAEEELQDLEIVAQSLERLPEGQNDEKVGTSGVTPETGPVLPLSLVEEPEADSALKVGTDKSASRTWLAQGASVPRSKRKRMGLKTGSGRWNHAKVYRRRRRK